MKRLHRAWLPGVGLFLWACAAGAETQSPVAAAPSLLGGMVQMFLGLSLVLVVLGGLAWLLKRLAPGQRLPAGSMKVLGAVAVGPKERVVLVELGETWLVLGVAPGQVNTVHTMPRQALPENPALPPATGNPFADRLLKALHQKSAGGGRDR